MTCLLPACEVERLSVLRGLSIVDTEPEAQFDAICRHACDAFRVPIAYVALIDEARQWLKAACGMDLSSVPREGTICSRTILLDRLLIVCDAKTDRRFAQNLYVQGPPFIRFYAGAPLTVRQGIRVGTLCLVDIRPRDFSLDEEIALRRLAEDVAALLRMRETVVSPLERSAAVEPRSDAMA